MFASGKETLLFFKKRSYESFPSWKASCKPSFVLRTLNNDRAKYSIFQIIINKRAGIFDIQNLFQPPEGLVGWG